MNVRLKPFSIFVILALLLSIGVMGGCTGSRQACWSEYLTVHGHYIATRQTDPNDDSEGVWVVEPRKAVTKRWSDKGEPDLVALSSESFKGTHEVTFGEPKGNKVIITARATARRTWRGPWYKFDFVQHSEHGVHSQEYTFTCNKDNGRWKVNGGDKEVGTGDRVFAPVKIDYPYLVSASKDTSTFLVKVVGQYGCGSYRDQTVCSQETDESSTTYTRRYGLVPDSPAK